MATNPITLLQGTTANATDVETKVNPLYTSLDSTNFTAAQLTGSGKMVCQTSPTISSPTISGTLTSSSLTLSGSFAGTPTFSGNVTFSGNILLSASSVYLDGTSATSIRSSAANTIALRTNSVDRVTLSTTALTTTLDIALSSCSLLLDGTSATSIRSNAANSIALRTNATDRVGVTDAGLGVAATGKIFLDGIANTGDTYIIESSANVIDFYAGATNSLRIDSTQIACDLVNCSDITTDNGTTKWTFGGATAGGDTVSNGYVTITINGAATKIMRTA